MVRLAYLSFKLNGKTNGPSAMERKVERKNGINVKFLFFCFIQQVTETALKLFWGSKSIPILKELTM